MKYIITIFSAICIATASAQDIPSPESRVFEVATVKFEVEDLSDNLRRIYDIEYTNLQKIPVKLELKNWKRFYPETIKDQFIKDLQKMKNLDELKWVFNNVDDAGLDMVTLKNNVIKSLKNADGTPIKELVDIFNDPKVAKQVMDMFGPNATHAQGLINRLENESIFNQLFKIIE